MSKIKTRVIENVLSSDLLFDPENPRLPKSVDGHSEVQVIEWMLENENVLELMASIAEKGFFSAEPLLVMKNKNNAGKFNVVEGNRRLTAIKLLKNPMLGASRKMAIKEIVEEAKAIDTLFEIPVIVFDDDFELQIYLGYRHITGVQPWDSLAKARYLKKMKSALNENNINSLHRTLAKTIGSRADHVKLLLTGLDVYETIEENGFFEIKDLDEKNIKFGVLYTAINNSNISTFIGIDLEEDIPITSVRLSELKELTKWMFEKNSEGFTRLGESRNLRLLNKVVADKKALEAFRSEKSLRDAVLLTDEPDEIFSTSLAEALSKLETARDYMHLISENNPIYSAKLTEIRQISKVIASTLIAKDLEENDD